MSESTASNPSGEDQSGTNDDRATKRYKISADEAADAQGNVMAAATNGSLFNEDIIAQYTTFYRSYKLPGKKTKNIPSEILSTRRSIQHCCRDNDLPNGLQVLQTAVKECVYLEAQSFYNLLNLCEGSFNSRVHVGTPRPREDRKSDDTVKSGDAQDGNVDRDTESHQKKDISLSQRLFYANTIHSLLSQLNIPCTEPTYTALIRLASRVGDFTQAEKYLDEAEGTQQCKVKLRMYSALLRGYCGDYFHEATVTSVATDKVNGRNLTKDNLINALKVWIRMFNNSGTSNDPNLFGEGISPKIQLSEIEYASLIKAATELHDGAVMERVLSDLAERVLIPGLETTESILGWFRADSKSGNSTESSALDNVTVPPREGVSIGEVCTGINKRWRIFQGCTIDSPTGQLTLVNEEGTTNCDLNDTFKLKPVELTENNWVELRKMNSKIVVEGQLDGHMSQYQGGGKGKKRLRDANGNDIMKNSSAKSSSNLKKREWRADAWKQFESFIEAHPPYNTVIDGANVGYFQQNFGNAPKHVDYEQIDWLLRHLLEQNSGQHIILFLHERHFSPKLCPPWAFAIIEAWDGDAAPYNKLTVYRTPSGMNDDWYWMHAALVSGTNAQPVLAVTNDEMRDHHFQMLAQGSFLRWKERHQVVIFVL